MRRSASPRGGGPGRPVLDIGRPGRTLAAVRFKAGEGCGAGPRGQMMKMKKSLWRGQLFVHRLESEAKYKDIVRVSQTEFKSETGEPILHKNNVYRLTANKRSVLVALRGSHRNGIAMDMVTRKRLGLEEGRSYHFEFGRAGWVGQFIWTWEATDPAYRIASRLGLISLVLGVVGVLLGILSLFLAT